MPPSSKSSTRPGSTGCSSCCRRRGRTRWNARPTRRPRSPRRTAPETGAPAPTRDRTIVRHCRRGPQCGRGGPDHGPNMSIRPSCMPRRERSRRTARGFAHEARDLAAIFALLALVLTVAPVAPAHAAVPGAAELQRLEDQGLRQIVVARDPGLSATARAEVRADAGVAHVANLLVPDTEVVRADPGRLVEAIHALEAEPGVRYAEPDADAHAFVDDPEADALVTDPMWPDLWAL